METHQAQCLQHETRVRRDCELFRRHESFMLFNLCFLPGIISVMEAYQPRTWLEHWSVETDTTGSLLWLSTAATQRFIKLLRTTVYFADLGMIKDVRPVGGGLIISSEVKVMLASVSASGSMLRWGNVPSTLQHRPELSYILVSLHFFFLELGSSVQLFFTVGLKCPANLTCFIIKIQKRSKEEVQRKVTAQIQCAVECCTRYWQIWKHPSLLGSCRENALPEWKWFKHKFQSNTFHPAWILMWKHSEKSCWLY